MVPWQSNLPLICERERGIALESRHGIWPPHALKGESRVLSRVVAGTPGSSRLVPVTSGSFSGCLWEVRNTVQF